MYEIHNWRIEYSQTCSCVPKEDIKCLHDFIVSLNIPIDGVELPKGFILRGEIKDFRNPDNHAEIGLSDARFGRAEFFPGALTSNNKGPLLSGYLRAVTSYSGSGEVCFLCTDSMTKSTELLLSALMS